MTAKQTPRDQKLNRFCNNLEAGRYPNAGAARSALGATTDLTDNEVEAALFRIKNHDFKKPPLEAKKDTAAAEPIRVDVVEPTEADGTPADEVGKIVHAFVAAESAKMVAVNLLCRACSGDEKVRYGKLELKSLLRLCINSDVLPAFAELVHAYSDNITGDMIDLDALSKNRRFFLYAAAVYSAPSGRSNVTAPLTGFILQEAVARSADGEQVRQLEHLFRQMQPRVAEIMLLPLVIEYASMEFASAWLEENPNTTGAVALVRRALRQYLAEELGAEALIEIVDKFEPPLITVEEVVRTFFSRRQLGDALALLSALPMSYQDALFPLFEEVARRYADPVGLLAFGSIFDGIADRAMIKRRIKEWAQPDQDAAIDTILDGGNPRDFFNSFGSEATQEEIEETWNLTLAQLGLPPRPSKKQHRHARSIPLEVIDLEEIMSRVTGAKQAH